MECNWIWHNLLSWATSSRGLDGLLETEPCSELHFSYSDQYIMRDLQMTTWVEKYQKRDECYSGLPKLETRSLRPPDSRTVRPAAGDPTRPTTRQERRHPQRKYGWSSAGRLPMEHLPRWGGKRRNPTPLVPERHSGGPTCTPNAAAYSLSGTRE